MKLTLVPLLACAPAGLCGSSKPEVTPEKLEAEITTKGLMSHLVALDGIARANGGNRAFGLSGFAASVDYIWGHVSNLTGIRAWKQDFSSLFDRVESIELRADSEPIRVTGLIYSPSTGKEGITAEITPGVDGDAGCQDASYADLDVRDKIVLVQRGRCPTGGTLAGRLLPAARAGAAAVIIYNDADNSSTIGTLSAPNPEFAPGGLISRTDGLKIRERLTAGEQVTGYFQQTQIVENRTTQNIFAETEDGDPNNVVVVGAHLDSVQEGPGINDDGSGSSLILELLLAASQYRTKNRLRFAWWGAEENGLLGSRYYCSSLNLSEADGILAYLNFDMVSRGFIGVGDGDGSTHGSVAPPGSEVIEGLFNRYFATKGVTVTPVVLTNGSDYASFWRLLNKPFGYLHTGTGAAQDPCYHQACDTLDNVVPETITTNARAAAHVLAVLATNGTSLIRKTAANSTFLANMRFRNVDSNFVDLESVDGFREEHAGCSHAVW